ncbi:MAG: Grx4 family monothiol glutaredoxin [Deltaproteobacteria bacterium]|jgi:monothiol glutaredoxin|nr:Grx4 family monothiol glutaredoxin [Deltaproteobacteria bacterium]
MSDTKARIEKILSENKIVLFMKGSPQFPQCGFSARATAILNECGAKFHSVDVLQDPEIREGIKVFGNWPTVPQLYVNKELIGGSDIMMEMFEAGELQPVLKA